jgi:glucokinase
VILAGTIGATKTVLALCNVPHKLLPALQSGGFTKRFNSKGRFSRWTQQVGVRVLVEPRAGLLGAASYAATST